MFPGRKKLISSPENTIWRDFIMQIYSWNNWFICIYRISKEISIILCFFRHHIGTQKLHILVKYNHKNTIQTHTQHLKYSTILLYNVCWACSSFSSVKLFALDNHTQNYIVHIYRPKAICTAQNGIIQL